jgi:hypothetical protein
MAGGIKHDQGKPRMELLSAVALKKIAEVMSFGAHKYEDHNWRKGFKWSRLYGAALRHTLAHMDGEDKDPETGLSHLAHAGCCIMFLLEHEARGLGEDDRFVFDTDKKFEADISKLKNEIDDLVLQNDQLELQIGEFYGG